MKVYVAYCEGFMCSDWVAFAGTDLEKVKQKILKNERSVDEIKVYDGDTMEYLGYIKHYQDGTDRFEEHLYIREDRVT